MMLASVTTRRFMRRLVLEGTIIIPRRKSRGGDSLLAIAAILSAMGRPR